MGLACGFGSAICPKLCLSSTIKGLFAPMLCSAGAQKLFVWWGMSALQVNTVKLQPAKLTIPSEAIDAIIKVVSVGRGVSWPK